MDFSVLERLRRDLHSIKALQVKSLHAYFDARVHGFVHLRSGALAHPSRFSIASSATCVASLVRTGQWLDFEASLSKKKGLPPVAELAKFLRAMLRTKPQNIDSAKLGRGNMFALGFALEGVKLAVAELVRHNPSALPQIRVRLNRWIREATTLILKNLEAVDSGGVERGSAYIPKFRPTTFLTQLTMRALRLQMPAPYRLPSKLEKRAAYIYADVAQWSWRQILHELALLTAGNRASDPLALAYAVICFVECRTLRELTLDETRVVAKGLEAFFASQLTEGGGWQQSRPLHFYPKVGNAYCYDAEVLAQLLQCEELSDLLVPYLPRLGAAFRGIEASAQPVKGGGLCWSSGHHPHLREAESWSTASVYHFVHNLDRLLAEGIRQHAFNYVGVPYTKPKSRAMSLDAGRAHISAGLLDSQIVVGKRKESLVDTLLERFLEPISREASKVAVGQRISKATPISGILFGPPGTSKSELAKLVAAYLQWPLLSIDPSHVVKRGLDQVQAESNLIFGMLASLEQTVVFLDEFDELMRERTSPNADITSRFLTTAMLPRLTSIRESRRIVFLLATNHVSKFDFAIRRPGRFDVVVQVMPPTWAAKQTRPEWKAACRRMLKATDKASPTNGQHGLTWTDMLEGFTYLEFGSLCEAVAKLGAHVSDKAVLELINDAWGRSTLAQTLDERDDPDGSESAGNEHTAATKLTWRRRCQKEETLSRFM